MKEHKLIAVKLSNEELKPYYLEYRKRYAVLKAECIKGYNKRYNGTRTRKPLPVCKDKTTIKGKDNTIISLNIFEEMKGGLKKNDV